MGNVHIVSNNSEAFFDRRQAGHLLARALQNLKEKDSIVVGIPRGGIIVAHEIALVMAVDMDILLSRKLGAPYNPELAIGAVSENGQVFINKEIASYTSSDERYIEQEVKRQIFEMAQRTKLFRQARPKVSLKGRVVIITDDGVATGATMQAALWAARHEGAKTIIAAVPVGPQETLKQLSKDADEVICLKAPQFFSAVGQFYMQFEQINDENILALLKKYYQKERGNYG